MTCDFGTPLNKPVSDEVHPHLFEKYFYPSHHHLHPYNNFLLSPSKRKGGQVRFTPQQTQILEKRFSTHRYLSPEERRNLAKQLRLSDRQVKTWFQNRRAKFRRVLGGSNSAQNKFINRHISNYDNFKSQNSVEECNNSRKSSSSSLDLRLHVNDINVDGDETDEVDEEEFCSGTETDEIDILERKHMEPMLQNR
uniref:CSON001942 protein n=1 Tax=Culicoides sonorensis TaxID=179676 RepID=A0A336MJ73_CULSO